MMRSEKFNQFLPFRSKVQIETVSGSNDLTGQVEQDFEERVQVELAHKS
jgi:hypothetical protein